MAKIKFGKHRGIEMANVPHDYYRWLNNQRWFRKSLIDAHVTVRKYIEDNCFELGVDLYQGKPIYTKELPF